MDTFVLRIKRQTGIVAAASSTKVIIDGTQRINMRVGGVQYFTLPRKPVNVILLNQVPLGKDIEEMVTIDPRDSAEVTLLFSYKFNPKILLPFGAFTQQASFFETEVIHGPSLSNTQSASASHVAGQPFSATEQPQQSPAPESGVKYCTECGTPNPQAANFCKNCGNKF